MFAILLLFLAFGIPIAAFFSLLAGIKVFRHNRALAGLIVLGAIASALAILWEYRYDIDLIRNLIKNLWGFDAMQMSDDLELDRYFLALYTTSALAILFARFRWRPQYGSALVLNLALVFWVLAGLPFLILTPGMFAP